MSDRLRFSSSVLDTISSPSPVWESPMFGMARKFCFIKETGKLLEQSARLEESGFRLTRMVTTGHELEIEVHDSNALLLPITGRVGYRTGSIELWARAGTSALLSRPNSRWSVVDPVDRAECEALVLQFPDELGADDGASDAARTLRTLPDAMELRVNGAAVSRLLKYVRLLASELMPENSVAPTVRYVKGMTILLDEGLQDAIEEAAGDWVPDHVELRDLNRARAAEDIIRARFSDALSVKDIAGDLGINVRSLQLAFKDVFGLSPREMITRVRLEHAHTRLLHAGPQDQVATIAWGCGFTHLGRFAQAYRKEYGEAPNETLARSHRKLRPVI